MPMLLYEVIRWGNDGDDPLRGGPDGVDTCFLVRADSVEAAGALADRELARSSGHAGASCAGAVYLLGADAGSDPQPRVLRGPYLQHAHRHGWRHWYRDAREDPWIEKTA